MKFPVSGATLWLCKARYVGRGECMRKSMSSPWFLFSYSSYSEIPVKKAKATPLQETRMIDRHRLHVKGGDGGNGSSSLRRSRHDSHGKPDGGNGGRGGDVILRCTSAVWDLRGVQHHINGKRGGHGTSKNKIGSRGEDKIVQVPVGTVIHLVEGEIPSLVEKPASGDIYPWDVPGTIMSDICVSDKLSTSCLLEQKAHRVKSQVSSSNSKSSNNSYSPLSTIQTIPRNNPSHGNSNYCGRETNCETHYEYSSLSSSADNFQLETEENVSEEDWQEVGEQVQYNVAELTQEGQQIIVAHGGEGGLGSVSSGSRSKRKLRDTNHHTGGLDNFEETSDQNEPSVRAGLSGSKAVLILELKSIADVGLVGMPNAGKSTLLGAISRAKPAVGHYAFTTLRPNIGKLHFDEVQITVADIPGLIKGAHENRGLGHAFLRHIERTKILVYVVDLAAALDGRKGIPPWQQLKDLVSELEHYREGLSDRPSLVVANKIDEPGAEVVFQELQRRVQGVRVYPVCAVLEEGIPEFKAGLRLLVNDGELTRLTLECIRND